MPDNSSHPRDHATEGSGASEFTQLFGKSLQTHDAAEPRPIAVPAKPAPHGADPGFTAIFGTAPPAPATESKPLRELQPSEAPTQMFAAVPQPPNAGAAVSAADETRLFSHAVVPTDGPRGSVAPAVTPAAPPQTASEFTSVFQPIAPPPPMPAMAAAPVAGPAPGEFTQIFSAVSARASVAEPVSPAAPSPQPARPVQAAAPPAAPEGAAGEFTLLFQRQPSPKSAAIPATPTPHPVPLKPEEQNQPGSFTQLFSQPSKGAVGFQSPPAPPSPAAPLADAATPFASQPIFGTPAPRGSFTDIFAAPAAPPPASGTASAGFADPFAAQPTPASPAAWSTKPASAPPVFNAPVTAAAPAPPHPAAGEFTSLMQSLERPASPLPVAASNLPLDAAFFAPSPASSAGESEYTRVMRGGGAAPAASHPVAAPASGSVAAPGLSLAPAAPAKTPESTPAKEKPKPLVILLVVTNVILLIALLVIGIVVLHRH